MRHFKTGSLLPLRYFNPLAKRLRPTSPTTILILRDWVHNCSSAMFPLRLKTKLVLAITTMVVVLVATLSSIYISQLIKQRVDEAFQNGEFVASEVFQSTREALETDLANDNLDLKRLGSQL